jgi:hypothetical protein
MEAGDVHMVHIQKKILEKLHDWDRNVLGELEKRINKAKGELERCRRGQVDQENVNREHMLRYKLERLQDQLHIYWKQRAHKVWLTKGDRNTRFFHASAFERRRRNYIKSLKGDSGEVVAGAKLKPFIADHYKNLFSSCAGQRTEEVLSCVERRVSRLMNEILLETFTGEDVEEALRSIGDLKAPGLDGIPSVFYKRFWSLVGNQVKKEVLVVLNRGPMPQGWNDTIIVLIPKVKNLNKLKYLHPISLCNVLYKLIFKVLANRLKKILTHIISPSQSAFVPGRLITDNVLLAYEMAHYLRNKRRGKIGCAAIKLDMSKAYDRVEWLFLEKMMRKMGFAQRWIQLIMKCVTSVCYRIKINGEYTEPFKPQRGLAGRPSISIPFHHMCRGSLCCN